MPCVGFGRRVWRDSVEPRASIVIPRGVHPSAVQAIVDEGAEVTELDASYEEAVVAASRLAEEIDGILVQDAIADLVT